MREQRAVAVGQAREFATSLHEITLAGLTGMMQTGNAAQRGIFLDQIRQTHGVESLKVLRGPAVTAQFGPGLPQELPGSALEREVVRSGSAAFLVVREGGGDRLRAVIPAIASTDYLGKNCLSCHRVEPGTVLGAVAVEISLARVDAAAALFGRRVILVAILLSVPLGAAVFFYIRRTVTRPLRRVSDGLDRIAAERIDCGARLEVERDDEIGRAQRAFNRVIEKTSELIDAQTLAKSVFDNSLQGILVSDHENRIQSVNRAFEEITGYSLDEARGRGPNLLKSGVHDASFYEVLWASVNGRGQWQGEIWNRRKNGEVYPEWLNICAVEDGQGVLSHYIGVFSDITEHKRNEATIRFQAHHDWLTGLANRVLLRDRLEMAISAGRRHRHSAAVLLLDLDRFKLINDTLGHDAGDELLRAVAERLTSCVRESDTVARLGGDEFTILLAEVQDARAAVAVGEKVLSCLRAPFELLGREVQISASVGLSLFPDHGSDSDSLMKNADTAMYVVKSEGRDGVRPYHERLALQPSRRLEMQAQLQRAIQNGELFLLYQPQLDLTTGHVRVVEALIRWQHPALGVVDPDDFIPLAEESGLIVPIGEWVLEKACSQAAVWRDQGRDLVVAVNLSARQFHRTDIVRAVRSALERSGLPAERLELEITESLAMHDVRSALRTMNELAGLGVRLAIDDFGSGYSSLASLQKMPVATLKIDRCLVRDLVQSQGDRSIVSAVIGMAHRLGLRVVAEGVETAEQRTLLAGLGSDGAQGFEIGRPLSAAEFASRPAG